MSHDMLQEDVEAAGFAPDEAPPEPPRRGPGRPRGSGHRIRANAEQRELILKDGMPLAMLCKVARGRPVTLGQGKEKVRVTPSLEQVLHACEALLRKVLPDLKSSELMGEGGGPIAIDPLAETAARDGTSPEIALGRRLGFILAKAAHADPTAARPRPRPVAVEPQPDEPRIASDGTVLPPGVVELEPGVFDVRG